MIIFVMKLQIASSIGCRLEPVRRLSLHHFLSSELAIYRISNARFP